MGSSKKAPAPKKDQLAAAHSASAAIKSAQALQTAKATKAPDPATKAPPPAPKAPPPAPTETGFTHHLPTKDQIAANGRRPGRNLVLWQRPRMAEKLLHCLIYEMELMDMRVSWNNIAHRLRPGTSGSSLKQYIHRSRNGLVAEGHVVAPLFKRGKPYDPTIRGYVRDVNEDGEIIVRAVGYGEYIEDPRVNEPDALAVLDQVKAQLETQEASDVEGAEDFDFEEDISPATCFTIPDDANNAMPPSPTPARHAAPRQSVSATEHVAEPQGLQLSAGQAMLAQETIAPVPVDQVADISAANVWADNIQELQNFDANTLFQLGIGFDFADPVETNSAAQTSAAVTESPILVTQTDAPTNPSPVAFTQASPETTSISQAPLELDQISNLPADTTATLFQEFGAGFPFVLGSETLHDPFSIPAATQPYQAQINLGGQYVQQQAQQQVQQPLDDSWFWDNSLNLLEDQLFTPSQTNASLPPYDFSMPSTLSSTLPSSMSTTTAPVMSSTMGPVMTPAFANVMTPAMTPSPEHKAAETVSDAGMDQLLQFNKTH
ncbi:hypothetical protein MKX07_005656 [Trichoderma sp. CBMAI-0711]|uniref:Uncharacterized protein n=1 Tax=Trichoderma parareesei TaxID=858221 RepID=A0A2H2ZIM3_TRIPA|nr:hypothetical protein MKX07_005656 [Trichoderma sp. CBMAI-0711]OTA07227.1 hypothetical protein A9Z42_0081180 [Trichoderma parareesei]